MEHYEVVVIGGGQAGLSAGYYLKKQGVRFVILDAAARTGDAWRKRWDSLRLFSPNRFNGLDGMPFPGDPDGFATKDEMADYLEAYAKRFELPILHNMRVEKLSRAEGPRFTIRASGRELEADRVIIAMGNYQKASSPPFAKSLDPKIVQMHSTAYKNPSQLAPGGVLVVGAGNSGAEIAFETAKSHHTWLSGKDVGEVPFRVDSFLGRWIFVRLLFRVVFHRILSVATPIGRRARPKALHGTTPLIRQKSAELRAAGIERVSKTIAVKDGRPQLEDGRVLEVANVIWCTGFDSGLSFIDLPIFDEHGEPRHTSGVVDSEPGLFFVGQHFLHAMSSSMIHGVGRDAARIAGAALAYSSSSPWRGTGKVLRSLETTLSS